MRARVRNRSRRAPVPDPAEPGGQTSREGLLRAHRLFGALAFAALLLGPYARAAETSSPVTASTAKPAVTDSARKSGTVPATARATVATPSKSAQPGIVLPSVATSAAKPAPSASRPGAGVATMVPATKAKTVVSPQNWHPPFVAPPGLANSRPAPARGLAAKPPVAASPSAPSTRATPLAGSFARVPGAVPAPGASPSTAVRARASNLPPPPAPLVARPPSPTPAPGATAARSPLPGAPQARTGVASPAASGNPMVKLSGPAQAPGAPAPSRGAGSPAVPMVSAPASGPGGPVASVRQAGAAPGKQPLGGSRSTAVSASSQPMLTNVKGVTRPSVSHLDEHVTYQYNALGRRDPFQPLIGGAFLGDDVGGDAPPDIGGLRVVGIVWGTEDQFALAEDSRGQSIVLHRGDKVMNGYIHSLKRDGVVVVLTVDGQSQTVVIPVTKKGDGSNANR